MKVKIEAQPVVSASRTAYRKRRAWLKGCLSNAVRSYGSPYAIMVQILLADKSLIPQIGSRLAAMEIQGAARLSLAVVVRILSCTGRRRSGVDYVRKGFEAGGAR